jgi:uncharacterized membrane protein YeaQ/YmgE (transglycosylase-associated protein family)
VVGILGGLLGGAIFKAAGDSTGINHFSLRSLLVAFVGATILLFLWSVLSTRERT